MRYLILTLLAVAVATDAYQACSPGEVRVENCQSCTCAPDGSRFYCGGPPPCFGRKRRESTTCQSGDIKRKDCNSCLCVSIGENEAVWHCTEMACHEKERKIQEIGKQVCQPGETKKVDCNNCFCPSDGLSWTCTMMACLPKRNDMITPVTSVL